MDLSQFAFGARGGSSGGGSRRGPKPPSYWSARGGTRRAHWDALNDDALDSVLSLLDDWQLAKLARCDKRTRRLARAAARRFLGLSASQWEAYKAVLERGESVLIMGAPGSGKSFLLNLLKERMPQPLVTASTGAAAEKIGAQTFHSALTLGLGTMTPAQIMRRPAMYREKMMQCRSLILDEVAMLTAHVLDLGLEVLRQTRGGIPQFVACGDPLQLRAVAADEDGPFYKSKLVQKRLKPYILRESHRQGSRSKFLAILNRARLGKAVASDVRWLQACALKEAPGKARPPKLVCTNVEAFAHNKLCMEELPHSLTVNYQVALTGTDAVHNAWSWTGMPFATTLSLKIGARVLLTVNLRGPGYEGLHNGSTGTVTAMSASRVFVQFDCGTLAAIERHKMEKEEDFKVVATRSQMPLIVAFAVSIHRAQGATLDLVDVDVARAFAAGQTYVALSRARRIDHIVLRGLTLPKLNHVDREAMAFYLATQRSVASRVRSARAPS